MSTINEIFYDEPYARCRKTYKREKHCDTRCQYYAVYNWLIPGTYVTAKLIIRICFCGVQNDRREYIKRIKQDNGDIDDDEIGDGVEIHFSDDCKFKIPHEFDDDGYLHFRKVCYCYSASRSYLRY